MNRDDGGIACGDGDSLIVDVDGFEGPLDLLLELARRHKIDLQAISMLRLADQYLAFVQDVFPIRLELAADYLVMAAWLAYLKSRLLLPRENAMALADESDPAASLADRLQRLEAIRAAAAALEDRPRLGRDFLLRGATDPAVAAGPPAKWTATIFDLLTAYTQQQRRRGTSTMTVRKRAVWSLAFARETVEQILRGAEDWIPLDARLAPHYTTIEVRRTVKASALSVVLEMVKDGHIAIRQHDAFSPIWMKRRELTGTVAD